MGAHVANRQMLAAGMGGLAVVDEGRSLIQNQGQLRLVRISVVGPGGDVAVDFRPSLGEDYSVIWAVGRHTDSVARECFWQWVDTSYNPSLVVAFASASGMTSVQRLSITAVEPSSARERTSVHNPLMLNHKVYAQFVVRNLAANSSVFVEALVYRRLG